MRILTPSFQNLYCLQDAVEAEGWQETGITLDESPGEGSGAASASAPWVGGGVGLSRPGALPVAASMDHQELAMKIQELEEENSALQQSLNDSERSLAETNQSWKGLCEDLQTQVGESQKRSEEALRSVFQLSKGIASLSSEEHAAPTSDTPEFQTVCQQAFKALETLRAEQSSNVAVLKDFLASQGLESPVPEGGKDSVKALIHALTIKRADDESPVRKGEWVQVGPVDHDAVLESLKRQHTEQLTAVQLEHATATSQFAGEKEALVEEVLSLKKIVEGHGVEEEKAKQVMAENAQLRVKLEGLKQQVEALSVQHQSTTQSLKKEKELTRGLSSDLEDKEALSQEVASLRKAVDLQNAEDLKAKHDNMELRGKLEALQQKADLLTKEHQSALDSFEQEREISRGLRADLEDRQALSQEVASLRNVAEASNAESKKAKQLIIENAELQAKLQQELESVTGEHRSASESLEKEREVNRKLMLDLEEKEALSQEVVSLKEALDAQGAEGEKLNQVMTKNAELGAKLQELTEKVESVTEEHRAAIQALEKEREVNHKLTADLEDKEALSQEVVSLMKALDMQGSPGDKVQLSSENTELSKKLQELQQKFDAVTLEHRSACDSLEKEKEANRAVLADLNAVKEELVRVRDKASTEGQASGDLRQKNGQLSRQVEELQVLRQKAAEELEKLRKTEEEKLKKKDTEIQQLRQVLEDYRQQQKNKSEQVERLKQERDDLSKRLQHETQQVQSLISQKEQHFQVQRAAEAQSHSLLEYQTNIKALQTELERRTAEFEKREEALQQQVNDLHARVQHSDHSVHDLTAQLAAAQADLRVLTQDYELSEVSRTNLQKVLEQFHMEKDAEIKHIERTHVKKLEAAEQASLIKEDHVRRMYEGQLEDSRREASIVKEEALTATNRAKEEVQQAKRESLSLRKALDEAIARLQFSHADTVDRKLIANLVVTYFEKRRSKEILEIIVRTLNFSDAERMRIGLSPLNPENSPTGLLGGLMSTVGTLVSTRSPTKSFDFDPGNLQGQSLAELWFNYLMAETEVEDLTPKGSESPNPAHSSGSRKT